MNTANQKVIVGISGGVDSSVAALLLKQEGYAVEGVFMKNWEDADDENCTATQDFADAKAVCAHLDIPLSHVNFSQEYQDKVFQHFLREYQAGRTPNPDILCNKEIKFKAFLEYALSKGADYIATGHYAQTNGTADNKKLVRGKDTNKDQSYFLHALNSYQLSKTLFPIGDIEKPLVREIAKEAGFPNHNKKDSTGICFIGERKFKKFLSEFLLAQPGNIKTFDGKLIGKHDGLMYYTYGQRQGLGIGGNKNFSEEAWYVVDKDIQRNVLIVGQGHDHPALFSKSLQCIELHWINDVPALPLHCSAKTRYRQADQNCIVDPSTGGRTLVEFDEPQWAVTPGQSVVFYEGEYCLGGGIIERTLRAPLEIEILF